MQKYSMECMLRLRAVWVPFWTSLQCPEAVDSDAWGLFALSAALHTWNHGVWLSAQGGCHVTRLAVLDERNVPGQSIKPWEQCMIRARFPQGFQASICDVFPCFWIFNGSSRFEFGEESAGDDPVTDGKQLVDRERRRLAEERLGQAKGDLRKRKNPRDGNVSTLRYTQYTDHVCWKAEKVATWFREPANPKSLTGSRPGSWRESSSLFCYGLRFLDCSDDEKEESSMIQESSMHTAVYLMFKFMWRRFLLMQSLDFRCLLHVESTPCDY